MGKKGSWFSAIKRVFTPHSKEKLGNQEPERKSSREKKKKGFGKLRHGETNSFLPIFREPSSIEKILGEAEREHNLVFGPPGSPGRSKTSSASAPVPPPLQPVSPRVPSQRFVSPIVPSPGPTSPRVVSPRVASPRVGSPRAASPRSDPPRSAPPRVPSPKPPSPRGASPRAVQRREFVYRPEPTLANQHASATKIQAAFRGYMARRSFRALKGLVRLQGVVRGHSVKRQTMNAMKYMQLLVRVQTQIQSRRIQMLENQARRQAHLRNDEAKWAASLASEAGNEDWDDSVLTKDEKEARLQRKVDAIIKRERSMAYAYSHQLWRSTPKSAQAGLSSGAFPLWWNWVDQQVPQANPSPNHSQPFKDFRLTPTRPSPKPHSSNQNHFRFDNFDTPTPKSSKSTLLTPSRPIRTPQPRSNTSGMSRYSRGRALESPFKDDDSLTSCPPFSVPNYMTPTVSAKAKVRPSSNPKERVMGTPSSNEKRRLSFPLAQGLGSFKWNKGSLFMSSNNNKNGDKKGSGSSSGVALEKHKTLQSIGNLSVDSTVSMPATVGRKPFNRFV